MGGLFGGLATIIQQPNVSPEQAIIEEEEFLERYHPSLKYLNKFKGKNIIVTGATGAVGTAVVKKLLKSEAAKIVLFVKDRDNLDKKIDDYLSKNPDRMRVDQIDLREP